MKMGSFLKDKTVYIVIQLSVLALTFFGLYNINKEFRFFAAIVAFLYLIGCVLPLIREYRIKKSYYDDMMMIFGYLEKKNLIGEMIAYPEFCEGPAFYEILRQVNKDCMDEIAKYRAIQEEYREYIELWVHEIKTPIASARLVAYNNADPVTESITEELEKIDGYVMQALFYSRSNNVDKDYIVRRITLSQICNEVIKKNSRLFIQNDVSVHTDNLEFEVLSDTKWLEYILTQIVVNAIQYGASVLTFSANRFENQTVLTVTDDGIGIEAHELGSIFGKGFVGTNGRRNEKSTGMGLYICKKLCDKLGLGISASSVLARGTSLNITFPHNSMMDIF